MGGALCRTQVGPGLGHSWRSGGLSQRQIVLQAAPSSGLGQPAAWPATLALFSTTVEHARPPTPTPTPTPNVAGGTRTTLDR